MASIFGSMRFVFFCFLFFFTSRNIVGQSIPPTAVQYSLNESSLPTHNQVLNSPNEKKIVEAGIASDANQLPTLSSTNVEKNVPNTKPPSSSEKSYSLSECHSLQLGTSHDLQIANTNSMITDFDCNELVFCDDKLGFEAILALHRQLDDDANGDIDVSESNEFLRDELKYGDSVNDRQKAFHGNDKHITVAELWQIWRVSAVHNWTVEETVDWLCDIVELPQYKDKFELHAINGVKLSRLASNPQFYSTIGINNIIHRQKISLKATDVVLFGVPKPSSMTKDLILCALVIFAVTVGWYAFMQHNYSQTHLRKMLKDMEALSSAEKQLESLQFELNKTKQEHENASKEKRALEMKLKLKEKQIEITAGQNNGSASTSGDDTETSVIENRVELQRTAELEAQLMVSIEELRRYKNAFAAQQWIPPLKLQAYLQFTYEMEIKNYTNKKLAAEKQLHAAREECDKLKKKRSTLLGAFRVAHGSSIDYVDKSILQARTLMGELTKEMQERIKRWKMVEQFCGFDIIHNPGYVHLEKYLYGSNSSNSTIASPTMSTATSLPNTSYQIFHRNASEANLMDIENFDTSSISSTYTVPLNGFNGQPIWQNAVPMSMRKTSSSVFANVAATPSGASIATLPSCDAPAVSNDNAGMAKTQRSEDFTFANNNGKSNYPRRKSITNNPNDIWLAHTNKAAEITANNSNVKISDNSNDSNKAPRSTNIGYFRRGSSDGVEKHFNEVKTNMIPSYASVSEGSIHGQSLSKHSKYPYTTAPSNEDSGFLSRCDVLPKKLPFDPNFDLASSSSGSSANLSIVSQNIKASGDHSSDVTFVNDNNSNTDGNNKFSSKKKNFFGMRKRKSKCEK